MGIGRTWALLFVAGVVIGCRSGQDSTTLEGEPWSIDTRSYRLGAIGAFAEMVGAGVKKLALSAPMDSSEMDAIMGDALRICAEHDVEVYRETDFLVTDLFPSDLTDGKHVLLIYDGATKQEYLELKDAKRRLTESDRYDTNSRIDIARRFGALLSYSTERIDALLVER